MNKNEIKDKFPGADGSPFQVPEGYFANFESRLSERIASEDESERKNRKINIRPYLALVASISGIALITFTILQFVIGSKYNTIEYYDLAILEESGIAIDESSISDTYTYEELDEETSWEVEAMDYLASNDLGLEYLLALN